MKNKLHRASAWVRFLAGSFICGLIMLPGGKAEDASRPEDMLRFQNGDSLHGTFMGLREGILRWKHPEAREHIDLKADKLRRVTFQGGRSRKTLRSPSYVRLKDGDRIPGTLKSLDDQTLVMDTEFAGTVTIPREFITEISPRPHGGLIHYMGPFHAEEWIVVEPPEPKEEPKEEPEQGTAKEGKDEDEPAERPWVFSGGAYYSNGQLPIAVDTKSSDLARIRFTLAWRNRLNAAIAFHATLQRPEKAEPEDAENNEAEKNQGARPVNRPGTGSSGFAYTYGHSYVLTIYSNYAQIYRCDFNDEGEADMDRLSNSSANLRLDETGEAEFELRCDRISGTIALFANGRFVSQWEDRRGYVGSGPFLAFASQNAQARLRVSDVVVTAWNGMIDSAQSMEAEDRDVVLLTNGTDRFSGRVESLSDGQFKIAGTYAEMTVPQREIEEIRFAKDGQTGEDEDAASRQSVRLLLHPYGRLTIRPQEANGERLRGHHPALGELTLDLNYAGLMEFAFGPSVLDSWDDDY